MAAVARREKRRFSDMEPNVAAEVNRQKKARETTAAGFQGWSEYVTVHNVQGSEDRVHAVMQQLCNQKDSLLEQKIAVWKVKMAGGLAISRHASGKQRAQHEFRVACVDSVIAMIRDMWRGGQRSIQWLNARQFGRLAREFYLHPREREDGAWCMAQYQRFALL